MTNLTDNQTSALFGDLWHRYDQQLFEESTRLFAMRFEANGWDLDWFQGKTCLDVGCGGGRYSIAMAQLGAASVVGVDISLAGLEDARRRAIDHRVIRFEEASVLDLPFKGNSFDFVCCSGVLHHTPDAAQGTREICRVLRPGGKAYWLLYGEGGLRWPTIMEIRPHARAVGYESIDNLMKLAGLPVNKQRTFLDDFFVPLIDFYDWDRVKSMLEESGFTQLDRWTKGKLDHESSIEVQRVELQQLVDLFDVGLQQYDEKLLNVREVLQAARNSAHAAVVRLDQAVADFEEGRIGETELNNLVFGWGHHRVTAVKE